MPPDGGVTKVQQTGPGLFGSSPRAGAAYAAAASRGGAWPHGTGGNGGGMARGARAHAARRAGGRAPAADLFGGAAQAGGEEDVMTSAPVGMPAGARRREQAHRRAQREQRPLLAQRADEQGPGAARGRPMPASSEASGLIDIRAAQRADWDAATTRRGAASTTS